MVFENGSGCFSGWTGGLGSLVLYVTVEDLNYSHGFTVCTASSIAVLQDATIIKPKEVASLFEGKAGRVDLRVGKEGLVSLLN